MVMTNHHSILYTAGVKGNVGIGPKMTNIGNLISRSLILMFLFPPRVLQRHVLPITQYLLQDTEPQVRSSVCKQLPSLLCKVDQLSENLLLTSLLDAAQDSSANVRCAVLDVLIESEPYIYKGMYVLVS
uniref:Uncharacterized protein n=1 Tax=Cacopsylla melanoneura TaxID=428564 RepID=A0A8D8ZTM2_9HEMI